MCKFHVFGRKTCVLSQNTPKGLFQIDMDPTVMIFDRDMTDIIGVHIPGAVLKWNDQYFFRNRGRDSWCVKTN